MKSLSRGMGGEVLVSHRAAPTPTTTTTRTRLARHLVARHVVHTVMPRTTPAQMFRRRRDLRGAARPDDGAFRAAGEAFPIDRRAVRCSTGARGGTGTVQNSEQNTRTALRRRVDSLGPCLSIVPPPRLLYGNIVSSPHYLRNLQGRPGVYFLYPDVSIGLQGRYMLV